MSFLGISAGGNAHHAIEALMALGASALTGLDDIAPKNAKKNGRRGSSCFSSRRGSCAE